MTVNKAKARRVTAASCWILIVTCGCWSCECNKSEYFPNACGVNLTTLCGQATGQPSEQRRRKRVLTDREAAASLNQHNVKNERIFCETQTRASWNLNCCVQCCTRQKEHASGMQVKAANTKREQHASDRTTDESNGDTWRTR